MKCKIVLKLHRVVNDANDTVVVLDADTLDALNPVKAKDDVEHMGVANNVKSQNVLVVHNNEVFVRVIGVPNFAPMMDVNVTHEGVDSVHIMEVANDVVSLIVIEAAESQDYVPCTNVCLRLAMIYLKWPSIFQMMPPFKKHSTF